MAYKKATTVYPEGSAPAFMLPPEITMMCSLLPGRKRLAISLFFTVIETSGYQITDVQKPVRSIIVSKGRFTYSEVERMIDANIKEKDYLFKHEGEFNHEFLLLKRLVLNLRKQRIRDKVFDSSSFDTDTPIAHAIIEELMVLANEQVAKILCEAFNDRVPLRVQASPDKDDLSDWLLENGAVAENCFGLKNTVTCRDVSETSPKIVDNMYIITEHWPKLLQATASQNYKEVMSIIGNMNNFPQQTLARLNLYSIKQKARYLCSSEIGTGICHDDLEMEKYTHFTSPLRRYIDIIAHRLVGAFIDGKASPYRANEIAAICEHCTEKSRTAEAYELETGRLAAAVQYGISARPVYTIIKDVTERGLQLNFNARLFEQPSRKALPLAYLDLVRAPKDVDTSRLDLMWQMRIYNAALSTTASKDGEEEAEQDDGEKDVDDNEKEPENQHQSEKEQTRDQENIQDHKYKRNKFPMLDPDQLVCRIPLHNWQNLMKYLQDNKFNLLARELQSLAIEMQVQVRDPEFLPDATSEVPKGKIIHHYRGFKLTVNPGSVLRLQLSSCLNRGMLTPCIQLFNVTPTVSICVQHQRDPIQCFSRLSGTRASQPSYDDIVDYIDSWTPALSIESATLAIHEGYSARIQNVPLKWSTESSGSFTLKAKFCAGRFLKFRTFMEETSPEGDYLCIKYQLPGENQPIWVSHCQISKVTAVEKTKAINVDFSLVTADQPLPNNLIDERIECTVEWIAKPLPIGRMQFSLSTMEDASELTKSIALGSTPADPHGETEGKLTETKDQPSIPTVFVPGLKLPMNNRQKQAIRRALTKPFTLIQGPPGTGKTITGARLACLFASANRRAPPADFDGEEIPAQVMYCGPSNKSVDVVAEKLKGMGEECPTLLRVYGAMVEHRDFPLPLEPVHPKRQESTTESQSNEALRDITLHWKIRKPSNPYSVKILEYDRRFREKATDVTPEEIKQYLALVTSASRHELAKAEIILCTCITASAPKFEKASYIRQVIVDECGMCLEPESMVPIITAREAKQVVLIGDHKQLRPIINCPTAENLGLNVSLFERWFAKAEQESRSTMLDIQYRMHESIMQFPSEAFYDGQLQCGWDERMTRFQPSDLPIWPAGPNLPIVFCHIEGVERSLPVSAAEGSLDSKSNMEEVNFMGQYISSLVRVFRQLPSKIAAMSFYRSQCTALKKRLKEDRNPMVKQAAESVITVVKSQGSEWDYVILSCVRSQRREEIDQNPTPAWKHRNLGITANPHQLNVAITRAKKGLIIIGNRYLLEKDEIWNRLLQHYEAKGCLVEARYFPSRK